MKDLEAFARLVQALAPWREQLVFIGGWAHRLHRFHPKAHPLSHQPVFTRDTDLALANNAPIEGDMKAALAEHGFAEELTGDHKPPVAHYILGQESRGFYAEFLTPLVGSGRKRGGRPDATMAKAGISAQKIRHLDILLVAPWVITLSPQDGVPLPAAMDVQVVHPLCFMVQKFLIQKERPVAKRAQDLLYVHDTVELFGALLPEFNTAWRTVIQPQLGSLADVVLEQSTASFSKVDDVIRRAALIPQDRRLSPDHMQLTCQLAFQQILGA